MSTSGILRRVALVTTEDSEEHVASIFIVKTTSELGTTPVDSYCNDVPSLLILFTLMLEATGPFETYFSQEPHFVTSQKMAFFNFVHAY
jgi:hypothetical protein